MHLVDALDGLPHVVVRLQDVSHMNAPDHQDLVFDDDVATNFGR